MTDEQNIINEAFENYLQSSLDIETRERIAAQYGETIAAQSEFIYKDALNCPVDGRTATMDAELAALHRFLDEKYSWLSQKARMNINYAFIMCWK
jgi:hypothetical protein